MSTVIAMPSVTQAMKAQMALQRAGVSSEVQKLKQSKSEGCIYSLRAQSGRANTLRILEQAGVTYLRVLEG